MKPPIYVVIRVVFSRVECGVDISEGAGLHGHSGHRPRITDQPAHLVEAGVDLGAADNRGSEPGVPESGQLHAGVRQHCRHPGELEEPEDHPEKPSVQYRGEEDQQQNHDAVGLERFQRALGLRAQVRFQRAVAVQAWDR